MQKSKLVVDFRLILGACILWSGGATFMRLQLKPGGHFWHQKKKFCKFHQINSGTDRICISNNLVLPQYSYRRRYMALCFVYVLYQQSLFDISDRLLVGCVYTVAAILVALPVWNFSKNIEAISRFLWKHEIKKPHQGIVIPQRGNLQPSSPLIIAAQRKVT